MIGTLFAPSILGKQSRFQLKVKLFAAHFFLQAVGACPYGGIISAQQNGNLQHRQVQQIESAQLHVVGVHLWVKLFQPFGEVGAMPVNGFYQFFLFFLG